MRRHLNTVYVTSEDAWVRKDGANIVVEVEGVERGRAPIHMIGGIICFTRVGMSPALMAACAETGVAVSFLTPNGRFQARVEGPRSGNVLLRRAQYRAADDAAIALPFVRGIVAAKAVNQRTVIRRALRDHRAGSSATAVAMLEETELRLGDSARRAARETDIASLRGIEGEAAGAYFAAFDHLVRIEGPAFRFAGRSRRPALDRINALLNFLYAMLGHDCRSALESVGLDPQVGLFHADRPGRASLALDLIEEFRPVLADRLALSLINRGQLRANDFIVEEAGAVTLKDDARKAVLVALTERKKEELRHPFLNETVTMGLLPHLQAQLLARHLRGDLDAYPPFIWK
ncbi:type I-C CRISPR-associated endonuclease Cas1c [Sphingomonas sp.]|uniref:type I-C CRISPR-associated endonuclease Cas1c n=1 Tax=Sphingomonas sp. TaxID=28214 RepID=UPI002CB8B157|nr:type I-C CRISPR-associated endonuclease Cas1c [Sphingomonas sp.]HTG39368.1 type I-C CRISPR-associated endonuclease Cas1c [Sphingomonas sp.]